MGSIIDCRDKTHFRLKIQFRNSPSIVRTVVGWIVFRRNDSFIFVLVMMTLTPFEIEIFHKEN
jgi:hypothetical protein